MPNPISKRSASPAVRALAAGIVGLVITAGALPARAQVQVAPVAAESSALTGAVRDARGLPLLGAFVAAVALGSDQPASIVVTDARGEFRFPGLTQGVYTLLVGSLGFAGTVVQGINVPATVPLSLQLDPQTDRELASLDAPLDLGWALRSSTRDVLRQGETLVVEDEAGEPEVAGPAPVAAAERSPTRWGPMGGEVRLWSFTNTGDSQTVGVTSLSLGDDSNWNFKAYVGDRGAVWAAGNISQPINAAHSLTVGFGYVGGNFDFLRLDDEARDSWIGRLEARDAWQISDSLQLAVAARYERHNYMADSTLLSPSVRLSYSPVDGTRLVTAVMHDEQGLDLTQEAAAFDVISLLGNSNLQLSDTTDLRSQKTTRYEFGVEQDLGAANVRVKAYFDDVTDELLGVYVGGPDGGNGYLLFNVGDTGAKGVEVGLAATLLDVVSGEVLYTYRERDEPYAMPAAFEDFAAESMDWEIRQTHDLLASVSTQVVPSRTQIRATYTWTYGMPVIRDGRLSRDYGRFDLRVRQPLPFQMLDTEWSAMVQVRNLLGPEYQGVYNVTLAELLGLSRGIAGGLAVRF